MSGVAILAEVAGSVPVAIIAPLFTVAFLTRFAGVSHAIGQGHGTMPWFPRAASWVFFGLGAALFVNGLVFGGFLGLVALDALGGFIRRPIKEKAEKVRAPGSRRRLLRTLGLIGYLALVALFHVFVGLYLPYGTLITWCLLALAFCVAIRVAVAGPKAGEAWLRAPLSHRRHERRETVVKDPTRAHAETIVLQFRARGDAAPFLEFVREAAHAADIPQADIVTLETRIAASFGRAGTGRDDDLRAALEEVERFLSLRDARPVEVRP